MNWTKYYRKVKKLRTNISHIYSDANSCYDIAFSEMKIPEQYTITKSETHLIESSNSSIRDNLARFSRKSKRFSKFLSFLDFTLQLFFYNHFLFKAISFWHSSKSSTRHRAKNQTYRI